MSISIFHVDPGLDSARTQEWKLTLLTAGDNDTEPVQEKGKVGTGV